MWARNSNQTRLPFLKGSVLDLIFGSDEKGQPSQIPEPGQIANNFSQGIGLLSGAAFHSNTINGRNTRNPAYNNQNPLKIPTLYRNNNTQPTIYTNNNNGGFSNIAGSGSDFAGSGYSHPLRGSPGGPPPTPARGKLRTTFPPDPELQAMRLENELQRAEMDRARRAARIGKAAMPPRPIEQIRKDQYAMEQRRLDIGSNGTPGLLTSQRDLDQYWQNQVRTNRANREITRKKRNFEHLPFAHG